MRADTTTVAPRPAALGWTREHAAGIVAVLVIAVAAAIVLVASRGTWFYLDEWDFASRAADLGFDSVLNPQNQNWHSTVVLVYRALLELFGFNDYVPFRLLMTALVIGVGVLGYLYARPRIGPWWALLPLALLIISPGFEILLWPFQMGQLISAVAGLGALLLLDAEPTRWKRVGVAALLVVALASSSAGVPLVAVIVLDRLLRRGRRLEVLLAAPAAIAYALWYAEYGTRDEARNEVTWATLNAAVRRAVDVGDGVMQSLLGLGSQGAKGALLGQIGLVVLVVVVCWRIFGRYSQGRERVIALAGALVTYWVLLAWGRASQAGIEVSPRYLFLSQILVLLLLVEVAVGVSAWLRDEDARGRRWAPALGMGLAFAVGIVGGLAVLHNARNELDFGDVLRDNARAMRGQVYGLALMSGERRARATVFLEPLGSQISRPAGTFFANLDRFGGPEPTEADVRALPADVRARVDQAQFASYVPPTPPASEPRPAGPAPAASVLAGGQARLRTSRSCVSFEAAQQAPVLVSASAPANGMAVSNPGQAPLTIQARRYASDWNGPARVDVAPGTSLVVRLPADQGSEPWRIQVAGTSGRLCSVQDG